MMTTRSSRPAHWLGSVALLVLVTVGALLPAGSASGYSHDWGAPVVRLGNLDPEPVDTPASAYYHFADFSGDPFVEVAAFSHDTLAGLVLATASLGHDYDEAAPRAHVAPTSVGVPAVDETEVWGDSSGSAVPRVRLRLPSELFAPSGALDDVVEGAAALDSTPGGRVYSAHYLEDTGPIRNIPGSVVDETIDHGQVFERLSDRTIYYDPVNNVTVVQSDTTGVIMSVRRGTP